VVWGADGIKNTWSLIEYYVRGKWGRRESVLINELVKNYFKKKWGKCGKTSSSHN